MTGEGGRLDSDSPLAPRMGDPNPALTPLPPLPPMRGDGPKTPPMSGEGPAPLPPSSGDGCRESPWLPGSLGEVLRSLHREVPAPAATVPAPSPAAAAVVAPAPSEPALTRPLA